MIESDRSAELRPKRIRPRQWDIFFSYAREDGALARELVASLEGYGFTVWSDVKLGSGDTLGVVDRALKASGVAIILMSAPYFSSHWLRREVSSTFEVFPSNRLYPILVGEIDVRTAPRFLAERQWLHLHDRRSIPRLVEKLRKYIGMTLGPVNTDLAKARIRGELPDRHPIVGADDYLRTLRSQLVGIAGVIGGTGAGKTALATEYAYSSLREAEFISWHYASTKSSTTLRSQLADICDLQQGVVIIDDWNLDVAKSIALVECVKELSRANHIVLTSRDIESIQPFRSSGCSLLVLGELQRGTIGEYLSFYSPKKSQYTPKELDQISDLTGGLPLAVRAMAYILQNRSIDDVTRLVEGPELSIETVLDAALDRLSTPQRRRLDVLCFCPRLLTTIESDDRWKLPDDDHLFSYLLDCGFLARGAQGRLSMHPGIVRFLRTSAQRAALEDSITYVASRLPNPGSSGSRSLLPSVIELAEMAEWDVAEANSSDLAELLIWQGTVWRLVGETARAEPPCRRALMLTEDSGQTLLRIRALNLQSSLAFDSGRIAEASQIEHKTAELALSELGPAHPISLATLGNLATTLRSSGDLPAAIVLLRRVVDSMPVDHPDRIAVQSNLAVCLREGGFVDEALELLGQARQAVHGRIESGLKHQLDQNMAALLLEVGRSHEALELLSSILADMEGVAECDYAERAEVQASLAVAYAALGLTDEALDIQADVVENCEVFFGSDHPTTLQASYSMAMLLIESTRPADAIEVIADVFDRRAKILGSDHPETLQAGLLEVKAFRTIGQESIALEKCIRLADSITRVLGSEHPMALAVREEVADLYRDTGDEKAAATIYRDLFTDLKQSLTIGHPMLTRLADKVGAKDNSGAVLDRWRAKLG